MEETKDVRPMLCYKCKHECCDRCPKVKWNIAEIRGHICCQCGEQASDEVWRSRNHGHAGAN